jgi:hypothetical protein
LGCSVRTNGSGLDLCDDYEHKFGSIPRGASISAVH